MAKISVIIIALNEEEYIEDCLKSIKLIADEIIVVDSGSQDKTINISKKYTKKVLSNKFETLGKQKQFALDQATNEWILSLDADERVSSELEMEIKQNVVDRQSEFDAYDLPYQNHFLGRPLKYGGEIYSQIRLFKKGKGGFTQESVHEEILVGGNIGQLNGKINHYSYKSFTQVLRKFTWYAHSEAEKMRQNGEKFSWIKMIKSALSIFRYRYFNQKGYKDGWAGFFLSLLFSYYYFASNWFLRGISKVDLA